ncbi:MAG TPA: HlyD family efflux transporter periplasmic adaptor subunit [Bryobacteraceae bacterium]|jgi:HlyD family secretion protein|nr:HlyD family efflux transporter periplasmic adaptor subunit [Bryobacteraceae bacterium]
MKKRIPILLILMAAGAGAYWWWTTRQATNSNRIFVSGNLELTQVDISFKMAGRMIERKVDEGDWVKQGDLVAVLDPMIYRHQKSRDEASVASAESNYKQLATAVAYQKATLESDIASKQADLNRATASLEELLNGSRQQDIQQAEAAVRDAKAQVDLAQADWDRAQQLFKNEDISRQQYDQYRTRLDSAQALLHQAEQKYSLVKEGPRPEDIAQARAQVAAAKAALANAEAQRLELRRKEEAMAGGLDEIRRSKAQVQISETQLADTEARSPISGVVLVKSAEPGEVLAAGTTVVTIGDLEHPWLRAYINETDLGRVKLGQKVKLTTDSYPGKVYWGKISFISSVAEFTPKQIQTKEERVKLVYRIKVDVDNSSHELKNNMPVDAEILL